MIKILETPRDAMQGIPNFIPTEQKVRYLNSLLNVGFDQLDFGSFVSPRAIPQLSDSAQVIDQLDTTNSSTEIIATIGNYRGAQRALQHSKVDTIAFPFSISESFLRRNINSNFEKGLQTIDNMLELCQQKGKQLQLYIAMAFGNPYNDPWNTDIVAKWVAILIDRGIDRMVFADTTGDGSATDIADTYALINSEFPKLKPGAHLHTLPHNWKAKLSAAYENSCRSFDTVLGGYGGCPMSGKALMGNLNTLNLLAFIKEKNESHTLNIEALYKAQTIASFIFANTPKSTTP